MAAWPAAQQTPPSKPPNQSVLTFRAESNYVEVDALVTDKQGKVVRDLTRDDFEVFEDSKRQTVSLFSFVDIPVERADRPLYRLQVEPDVSTNEKEFDGRVYVIVLDVFHVDVNRSADVKHAARQFVQKYMGANDLGAVIHIGNPNAGQEFTSSKSLLYSAIDRFLGLKLRSASLNTLADQLSLQSLPATATPRAPEDYEEEIRAEHARATFSAIERLSRYMAGLRGRRKAVLLFSEGIDFDTNPGELALGERHRPAQDAATVITAQQAMLAAATRANASIYTIDPRGLTMSDEAMLQFGILPVLTAPPIPELGRELMRSRDALRMYADETGGRAFLNTNDLRESFGRVVEENSTYYVLGYYTPKPGHDGKFRHVSVRVTRPGLEVRARNGYYDAPDIDNVVSPDPINELLSSPAAISGLGMRVNAALLRSRAGMGTVHLTVEMSGADLAFKDEGAIFSDDVDVSYQAVDPDGRAQTWWTQTMMLRLKPTTHDTVVQRGVRYVTEFELPVGRYQLRFAARSHEGGKTGSVFCNLEVPDFSASALAMSDVLVTASAPSTMLTAGGGPVVAPLLPGPTTAIRDFSKLETLVAFVEVYDSDVRPHAVDIKATVHADDGTPVFVYEDHRDSRELGKGRGSYGYLAPIPLSTMTPGRYVLTIEASSRIGDGRPITRDVEFKVR